ncbi:MAG: hypothetical protein JWN39_2766 [Ilumatobacteraceae bacterium]|nr:hypothetical protein [Ilumatobacteraceae bacterium]
MSGSPLIIGPYRFTTNDAVRTLGNLGGLWATQMDGRQSAAADRLGTDLARRIATAIDVPSDSLDALGPAAAKILKDSPALLPILTDVWTTLRAASDALRAAGQMPASATGRVVQLSASGGGVPKVAMPSADIGFRGVAGDVQRVRVHHGRPWQALCIYADEVIEELRAEGHTINRGSVGENITVAGLPWAEVRPGVLLRIGTALTHVQAFAEPCNSNVAFFLGGDFQRMNISRGPVSRVYATVLQPGHIDSGDAIVLEPGDTGDIESLTSTSVANSQNV